MICDEFYTDDFLLFIEKFFNQHGLEEIFQILYLKKEDASVKTNTHTGESKIYSRRLARVNFAKNPSNAIKEYNNNTAIYRIKRKSSEEKGKIIQLINGVPLLKCE